MTMLVLYQLPHVVGVVFILGVVYNVLRFLSFHLWTSSRPLQQFQNLSSGGPSWALISGSSAGLGFGFARALVLAGFNVVIHSHQLNELQEAAQMLRALRPGAQVEVLRFNAMDFKPEELIDASLGLADLPISILINNVGGCPMGYKELAACTDRDIDLMIDLNVRFTTHLTRIALPVLAAQPRALIVNISSGARIGMPLLSLYSASKGYIHSLSRSLNLEALATGRNIRSISITPGDVVSQSNHLGPFPVLTPTAEDYTFNAIHKMDTAISRGLVHMHPDWLHELQYKIIDTLPMSLWAQSVVTKMLAKQAKHDAYYNKSR